MRIRAALYAVDMRLFLLLPVLLLACAPKSTPVTWESAPGLLGVTVHCPRDGFCTADTRLTPGVIGERLGAPPEVRGDNRDWGFEDVQINVYPVGEGLYTVTFMKP